MVSGWTVRVRFVRKALQDLEQEATYLAERSPQAARDFVVAVDRGISQLRDYPASGRPGRVAGTRELVLADWPYIIPYRVREDAVEVLRVFHTRQKGPRKWT